MIKVSATSWKILDEYSYEFERIQEEKGILNPMEQREKIADACREYRNNYVLVRDMTEEERKLDAYWRGKIDDWLREEEIYYTECILKDFGYAKAEEYAFGQYRQKSVREFFENIRPCEYGGDCNLFCKEFLNCKGECANEVFYE